MIGVAKWRVCQIEGGRGAHFCLEGRRHAVEGTGGMISIRIKRRGDDMMGESAGHIWIMQSESER